jgi:hypothetical protein
MLKMNFVVFGTDNAIIDRLKLDLIANVSGVGFKLNLSTVNGDIENVLTKVVQEKQEMKFTINFINYAYEKSSLLDTWLQKYSTASTRLAIEYYDGIQYRYSEGKITVLSKGEKDEFGRLAREATFKPLTPFFTNVENVIKIKVSATGKSYPYKYPYSYGKNVVENNEINNPYILDVPITVKITGAVYEPTVMLFDENNVEYNRVKFTGVTLAQGQYIIINSAERKIYYYNGSELSDYSANTDPNYDTFLRARNGKSTISVNLTVSDTGEMVGSWRQYGL